MDNSAKVKRFDHFCYISVKKTAIKRQLYLDKLKSMLYNI